MLFEVVEVSLWFVKLQLLLNFIFSKLNRVGCMLLGKREIE